MISFEIIVLQDQQGPAIPTNQFEVWVVENEGGASFPWTPLDCQQTFHYLMNSATGEAIWGGRMNTSLPGLVDAGNK